MQSKGEGVVSLFSSSESEAWRDLSLSLFFLSFFFFPSSPFCVCLSCCCWLCPSFFSLDKTQTQCFHQIVKDPFTSFTFFTIDFSRLESHDIHKYNGRLESVAFNHPTNIHLESKGLRINTSVQHSQTITTLT